MGLFFTFFLTSFLEHFIIRFCDADSVNCRVVVHKTDVVKSVNKENYSLVFYKDFPLSFFFIFIFCIYLLIIYIKYAHLTLKWYSNKKLTVFYLYSGTLCDTNTENS